MCDDRFMRPVAAIAIEGAASVTGKSVDEAWMQRIEFLSVIIGY